MLWSPSGTYQEDPYNTEAELEDAIRTVSRDLFGPNRFYLDVKRMIGAAGQTQNIPDGYLIDLSSAKRPILYTVENELSSHDPLRHVAVQILQFSLSFEATPQKVKSIVKAAVAADPYIRERCETYAQAHAFQNIDFLLERMIYDGGFAALVIIDELPPELEKVLISRFRFGVQVMTLTRFRNAQGEQMFLFEPFLADVSQPLDVASVSSGDNATSTVDTSDLDTVVVPAREAGFNETALGEQRWYEVRMSSVMIPRIKHIAFYRIAPRSAITHIAPVQSIEPWQDTGYYVINFAESATELPAPIKMQPNGKIKTFQNLRYTSYDRLMNAKTLDEAF